MVADVTLNCRTGGGISGVGFVPEVGMEILVLNGFKCVPSFSAGDFIVHICSPVFIIRIRKDLH